MRPEPLLAASPIIQLHTAAAIFAAVFGLAILMLRKGTRLHRQAGYTFVYLLLAAAISSFWITRIMPGSYSAIHLLSIITIISLPLAIYFRRKGNIPAHAGFMLGPLAGLLIAGAATLLPGRILHGIFFG